MAEVNGSQRLLGLGPCPIRPQLVAVQRRSLDDEAFRPPGEFAGEDVCGGDQVLFLVVAAAAVEVGGGWSPPYLAMMMS